MLNSRTIIKKVGKRFIGVVSLQQETKGASPSVPPKMRSTCIEAQLVVVKFEDKIAQFIRNKR